MIGSISLIASCNHTNSRYQASLEWHFLRNPLLPKCTTQCFFGYYVKPWYLRSSTTIEQWVRVHGFSRSFIYFNLWYQGPLWDNFQRLAGRTAARANEKNTHGIYPAQWPRNDLIPTSKKPNQFRYSSGIPWTIFRWIQWHLRSGLNRYLWFTAHIQCV